MSRDLMVASLNSPIKRVIVLHPVMSGRKDSPEGILMHFGLCISMEPSAHYLLSIER